MDTQPNAWFSRIDEASDLLELERIDEQLAAMPEAWTRSMRFKIGLKRAQLRKASTSAAEFFHPVKNFGLPAPDGRFFTLIVLIIRNFSSFDMRSKADRLWMGFRLKSVQVFSCSGHPNGSDAAAAAGG